MRLGFGLVLLWLVSPLVAQTETRLYLPLPIETPVSGQSFDSATEGNLKGILTGFLLPASGPIRALAPLLALPDAEGRLSLARAGSWQGALTSGTQRLERAGWAVSGLRLLLVVSGSTVRLRQLQVFWRRWEQSTLTGPVSISSVYGAPAAATDTVRIIELRVPEGAVATGIYGQVDQNALAQVSLSVRPPAPASPQPLPPAPSIRAPLSPPGLAGPTGPQAPAVPRLLTP